MQHLRDAPRLLLAGLIIPAVLTACLPPALIPDLSRDISTQRMSEMKLLDLGAEGEVHALKQCDRSRNADLESCGPSTMVSLLLRPEGWSMAELARKHPLRIANVDPYGTSFSLPPTLPGATHFSKPLIGQRNTSDRFIGAFSTAGASSAWLVWLPPDLTPAGHAGAADAIGERPFSKVSLPPAALAANIALLLQDADKMWLFVRRDDDCEDSLCVGLDEVLQGEIGALPADLGRQRFALYFASDDDRTRRTQRFERVLKQPGRGNDEVLLERISKPQGRFAFDTATVAHSRFSPTSPSVSCEWMSRTASMVVMLTSEKTIKSDPKLTGCTVLPGAVPFTLQAEASPAVSGYASDDPPQSRRTSKYFCSPSPGPGQAIAGVGEYGCGFVLRNPLTHAAMPATPYFLSLNVRTDGVDRGERFTKLAGVTDREGRTAFVRTKRPIETALIGLIPRLRTASQLSGPVAEFAKRSVMSTKVFSSFEEGAIVWSAGRRRIPGAAYRLRLCTGEVHEARADENAMTVGYDPASKRPCTVTMELLSGP